MIWKGLHGIIKQGEFVGLANKIPKFVLWCSIKEKRGAEGQCLIVTYIVGQEGGSTSTRYASPSITSRMMDPSLFSRFSPTDPEQHGLEASLQPSPGILK
jgi:hypothetical protein